jgi:hypothetical protein
MTNGEKDEVVVLDEQSTDRLVRRLADELERRKTPKVETPPTPPAPTPTSATIADRLSALTDDEIAQVVDAVIERKDGKSAEPKTVGAALKVAMKENPEQALSTYWQAAGEQQRTRDEKKREATEKEDE